MSNFICPRCGMMNIDCGKDGYKTPNEIALEKKLAIATKTLRYFKQDTCSKPYVSVLASEAFREMDKVKIDMIKY